MCSLVLNGLTVRCDIVFYKTCLAFFCLQRLITLFDVLIGCLHGAASNLTST